MKLFNRPINTYSPLTAFISILFSIFGWLYVLIEGNYLWIPLGLVIINSIYNFIYGINSLVVLFNNLRINKILIRLYISISSIIFFFTSTYGLFALINILPIKDHSFFFIPYIIGIIYSAGASIGLYQKE